MAVTYSYISSGGLGTSWAAVTGGSTGLEDIPGTSLIIGGITISHLACLELTESLEPIEAKYLMRTGNGTLITRVAWGNKRKLSIQARGSIPPPFKVNDAMFLSPLIVKMAGAIGVAGVGYNDLGETVTIMTTGVSIEMDESNAWWSWSLEGEEI
jgi:hypothetical protein